MAYCWGLQQLLSVMKRRHRSLRSWLPIPTQGQMLIRLAEAARVIPTVIAAGALTKLDGASARSVDTPIPIRVVVPMQLAADEVPAAKLAWGI